MTDQPQAGVGPELEALEEARHAEKSQALLYRGLAGRAEAAGDADLAQRFHDLHADEQHHLSRLTARLLELGARPVDLTGLRVEPVPLEGWEATMRAREHGEIDRYQALLDDTDDLATRQVIEEILAVEEHHAAELGGKWTMA